MADDRRSRRRHWTLGDSARCWSSIWQGLGHHIHVDPHFDLDGSRRQFHNDEFRVGQYLHDHFRLDDFNDLRSELDD